MGYPGYEDDADWSGRTVPATRTSRPAIPARMTRTHSSNGAAISSVH